MASSPVIIRPLVPLSVPLVYNDSIDTTNMTNVLLIDSIVANDKEFYDSANAKTFPIIYNYNSSTDDLIALLKRKFSASSVQRIALVFHDKGTNFLTPFMNGKRLFEDSDLEVNQTTFTENVSFLISCISEFHVVNIDYLACNTLQYSNWKSYYALLALQTSVVVGASNNETGNINYGGDWVMENTNENVRDLYFTSSIADYASTLTLTTITLNGSNGNVGLRMNAGVIQYYNTTTSTWTSIGSGNWPVQFVNSNLSSTLKIVATQNLTITSSYGGTSGYLIAGSTNITFDGSGNTITLDSITSYPGFIDNYNTGSVSYANIIVQNFITAILGGSTLVSNAGWLCQQGFGLKVSGNQIIGCTNTGDINTIQAGGIAGAYPGIFPGGSISFINCTNSGTIYDYSGGIAGTDAGYQGSATFTNCTNTGVISGTQAGGIVGTNAGYQGSATFTNCTNSGLISGSSAGGIAGYEAGALGSATFTNCTNSGVISVLDGGIAGLLAGYNGSATFTNCKNTGTIGDYSGGIVGSQAGGSSGSVTITKCTNTGTISGTQAGGIAGYEFAYNTTNTCSITNCYSIGAISGSNAGGITGAAVGYTDSATYLPKNVNISNCYSLGAISSSAGGICGGTDYNPYTGSPTINITNCYSWGLVTDAGSGIVAISLPITPTKLNTYVANGTWSDTTANANLTGTPTSLTTGNPGATWTKIANNTTTPYVLAAFNDQLYSPNSASSASNYTTSAGLFTDTSYNYQIVYNNQVSNVATTRVFVAKGTPSPYYYSYNNNTFTFTNTGTATNIINATITPSNGTLNYALSPICFKKGTKILCENDMYIPIEELKIGDLVKTYKHGYQKVIMTAHISLCDYSQNKLNQLYTYSREKNPDLIEDLHLTGGHSLLLDTLTEEESNDMNQINWHADDFIVEDKYKLLAGFSCELYIAAEQNVEIYHFILEPPENAKPSHVYGIYANGILAESCSQGAMEEALGKNNMLHVSNTPA